MKRYVLLENKEIVDRTKAQEFSVYDREPIKLQSDNLIDLVEDKDLIECGNEGNVIQYDAIFDEITAYKNIVAIWKRNGDVMRRYEV